MPENNPCPAGTVKQWPPQRGRGNEPHLAIDGVEKEVHVEGGNVVGLEAVEVGEGALRLVGGGDGRVAVRVV